MSVTLGEEVMLLSLDDAGVVKDRASTRWAVAGGALLELAMRYRVQVASGRLGVTDTSSTGEELLDERLRRLSDWVHRHRSGRVAEWLAKDQAATVRATVRSLHERGLVTEEGHRALGLFAVRRYPEADGTVERELRERLARVVLRGARPDDRTSALVALLHGARLYDIAFPSVPRKEVEPRMAVIAEGRWAAAGARRVIRDMGATVASVTAVTDAPSA
ncbi:GPP34 family phosphoprotein [Streptomyces somaliensis DSM 40738]|uniref:GPP34 family phosphoprotein n=1 Tax=Streptomyces somaliensis (strain ATCC 33201 / DSM 40738 / JCM 12659 / KCTC 9044 / NCTC 11332 / NRRL B-12077 / IP 733) TaxID=1134445 RepID=A0AA44DBD4_STRE0|nr:GPP34 family phosphoprotein [Streptomyces somaliensis]MCQ0024709.1 GPP34 family phosphoprotein [Streptomyces somaliensis DSM 40738]NKY13182.1 GPP34 family phosphoprotein [Streptomyces somaliensis DSM 40738]